MNKNIQCEEMFIKDRLVKIRKSKGFTQEQLAESAGISRQTISNIESGKRSYTLRTLIKVAEALGCNINIDKKGDSDDS